MKKILAWLMLLTLIVGLFAGCKSATSTQTPTEATQGLMANGAQDAINYLKTYYTDGGAETPVDYTRFGIVRIGGVAYDVVWSVDVGEDLIKIVKNEDGTVTIDINEDAAEDTPYKLTATITDANGNTATYTWNYILPKAVDMVAIVEEAYALANGESMDREVRLRGKVISIDSIWTEDYQNITVTIEIAGAEDKPIKCYRMKGNADMAAILKDVKVGNIITVTGTLKNYQGTIEFDTGCLMIAWEKGDAVDAPTDPGQILKEAYALKQDKVLPYVATLTGTVTEIDSPYDPAYGNISVVIEVEGYPQYPILCYRLKGLGVDQIAVNDLITVSGIIKNYKGTIEYDSGCQMLERVSGGGVAQGPSSDPNKIIPDALKLNPGESLPYRATLTGEIYSVDQAYDASYNNVTVTIKVQGYKFKCYHMKGDGVDQIRVTDTITVSGVIKNYNGTMEFDPCTLDSWTMGSRVTPINYGPLKVDTPYSLKMDLPNGTVYFTGDKDGNYLATSKSTGSAATLYMEKVEGKGVLFYFMNGTAKKYIELENYTNSSGKERARTVIVDSPSVYWNYDTEAKVYAIELKGTKYFMGTYTNDSGTTFSTISCSSTYYIIDGNAYNVGKTQFVAEFVDAVNDGSGNTDGTSTIVTEPQIGTAYKLGFDQLSKKAIYYFTGSMAGYYGATETDATLGVDIYLEIADGGYKAYFTDSNGVKQYLLIAAGDDGTHINFKFSNTEASVFVFDEEINSLYTTLDDDSVHYMGTNGTYSTVNTIKEANKDKADYYLSHLYITTGSGGPSAGGSTTEPDPEEPWTPNVPTGSFVIYIAKDGKVVTSTNKPYNNKDQLTTANATLSGGKVSTAAADVLVVTAVTNADGSISFKTADGKFLHSDGTNTNLVAEENDNTKFILEETTGGYFIKLATFKYQGTRDQYLEYYASSLTSFGMGDDTAAFTFAFYELGNGTSEPVDPPASGTTATIVDAPEVETAYKLGMKIASGKTVYFNGNTDGKDYWLQTTENVAEAVDVKLASVDGGYHLYFMKDGTKTYIRVTTYVNNSGSTSGTLELTTTAPTEVLTFEETIKTLIYTAEESYYMGTYQNYDNISTSGLFRITGDNASALDTTQFPARLYTVEIGEPGTTEPDTTEPGTTEPSGDGSYVKITDASQFTSGQYVMIVDTGYAPGVVDGTWLTAVQPVVSGNTVTDAKGGVWTLTVNGSSVVIADSTGAAIGPKGDNANGLSAGSYDWAWSFADGKFQFAGTGEDTVVLASNATTTGQYPGNHRFRGYKTTTVTGQYASDYPCDFTLYKLDGEGGGSGTETIPPTGPTTTPTEPETTEPSDISSISEALAASSGTFTVKGVVTAVDSSNIYLQDATGAICVRMSAKPTDISLGDTIIGTGSRADYYGMPQLGSGTYEKSSGMTLSAKTTTIGALTTADICTYVKLTGLEVTEYYDNNGAYTNPNITVQDSEGNTIQIYKAVVSGVYNVGDIIDVTAAVGYYNKFQLRNTVASEITLSDGTGGGSTEPTEPEPTEPGTTSDVTITFADLAKGEQYVAENRDLGNGITIETNDGCQITTQLRIYQDDDGHDGKPVFTCSQVIRKLVLNAGYKDGASLDVYGSTDGTNWVKITTISGLTSAYADYTVEMPAGTSYKYLKLDAIDKQVRLPYITFTFDD